MGVWVDSNYNRLQYGSVSTSGEQTLRIHVPPLAVAARKKLVDVVSLILSHWHGDSGAASEIFSLLNARVPIKAGDKDGEDTPATPEETPNPTPKKTPEETTILVGDLVNKM